MTEGRKRKKAGSPVGLIYGRIVDVDKFSNEEISKIAKAIGKSEDEIKQLPGFPYSGPGYPNSNVPIALSDRYPAFLSALHYFLSSYIIQCFATNILPKQREVAIEIDGIVKKCREFIEFVVEPIPLPEKYGPRGGTSDAWDAAWHALGDVPRIGDHFPPMEVCAILEEFCDAAQLIANKLETESRKTGPDKQSLTLNTLGHLRILLDTAGISTSLGSEKYIRETNAPPWFALSRLFLRLASERIMATGEADAKKAQSDPRRFCGLSAITFHRQLQKARSVAHSISARQSSSQI
jgi:hypothetical protein